MRNLQIHLISKRKGGEIIKMRNMLLVLLLTLVLLAGVASAAEEETPAWELWSSALELAVCIVVVGASFLAYDKTKHNTLLYLGLTFICLSVAIDAQILGAMGGGEATRIIHHIGMLGAMVLMAKIVITPLVLK